MNTATSHNYRNGVESVHYTNSPKGTVPRRVKVLCGQRTTKTYFSVYQDDQPVNCAKCLAAAS